MLQKFSRFLSVNRTGSSLYCHLSKGRSLAIENQQCNYEAVAVKIRQRIVSFINVHNLLFSSVTNSWFKNLMVVKRL